MKLVIVESPAKAKTIEKYLGEDYEVISSVGHIRDLPKSNKKAIDMENGFAPHYQVVPGKEEVVRELKQKCREANEVILATDPDREGEAIAWHVAELCELEDPTRIVFHEITKNAVQEAIKHPRAIDENLRTAQEARRVLDRLFGYDLSGLIWKKVRYGLSAGRVQSPALRILMEREREIRAFIPEDFWVITADVKTEQSYPLGLTCSEEPRSEEEANRIVATGKTGSWSVRSVTETDQKRSPKAPFTTSTLQQTASSRLGFSPSRTMRLAQKLYEAGHITYMRTDSTTISSDAQREIVTLVKKKYGDTYAKPRQHKTKSKSAQEAHEAIRPTSVAKERVGSGDDQKKLYALIRQRAIASQMSDAAVVRTKITASITPANDKARAVPDFTANGSRIRFDGWLAADPDSRGEERELPKVTEGETLTLMRMHSEARQTEPPKRYTEAGLVKELEKRGIGRPSTYASIIQTIVDRGYADRTGRTLYPTTLGDVVESFLEQNFPRYISDSFTAHLEDELDEIAAGKRGYEKTLREFYEPFAKDVAAKKDTGKITELGDAPKGMKCPTCGKKMVLKIGRGGTFYSCANFPECTGARTMDGNPIENKEAKKTGEKCPRCEKGELVEREGKYGTFIGCNRYPKCRYIKPDENGEKPQNSTGVTCPQCGKGEIVERKGRFGAFYSCSAYPECKFTMKAKPTGNTCSECGSLMMEGTKTIPERCSKKECPMHNPHKIGKKD